MSREEVRQALRFAIQLQAGKYSVPKLIENTNPPDVTDGAATKSDNNAATGSSDTSDTTTTIPTSTIPNKAQIVLSQWALDTAFSSILNLPAPRMGRPTARKIDDILALVTDKHEKSLVGNVISPQDIGVTYDMIGKDLCVLVLVC